MVQETSTQEVNNMSEGTQTVSQTVGRKRPSPGIWLLLSAILLTAAAVTMALLFAASREEADLPPLFRDGLLAVEDGEGWKYVDSTGAAVLSLPFWYVQSFSEGLAPVKPDRDGQWGYIDTAGELVIPPQFDWASAFTNGMASVTLNDKEGYINTTGQIVIFPRFEEAYSFFERECALVQLSDFPKEFQYVDRNGGFLLDNSVSVAAAFADGLAPVCEQGRYGYIDRSGKMAISAQFEKAGAFSNGLAAVQADGKWGYIDRKGKAIIPPQFDSAGTFSSNGLAPVQSGEYYGYIDRKGKVVIPFRYASAQSFSQDGVAVVSEGELFGMIDRQGEYVASPQYEQIGFCHQERAWFVQDEKIGYLNAQGEVVVPAQFDSLLDGVVFGGYFYSDGYAVVKVGEKLGVIDKTGKFIINPIYDDIQYW